MKNNQKSVSDADLEILTLGSTDNAGNSVNLVSGIIQVTISLSASETDARFYFSLFLRLLQEMESHPDAWFRYKLEKNFTKAVMTLSEFLNTGPYDTFFLQNATKGL